MDLVEFGRRVGQVREEFLRAKQSELAEKLNITQVLLSRLENGVGGNIHTVFAIIDYLDSLGMQGHMLLSKDFSLEMLSGGTSSPLNNVSRKPSQETTRLIRLLEKQNLANNAALQKLMSELGLK